MITSCDKDKDKEALCNDDFTFNINGHEAVDLGLSVKWASCNIGAENATDFGSYFSWGETHEKESYGDKPGQYQYGTINIEDYPDFGMSKYNVSDDCNTLKQEDDAATKVWGHAWRTPTKEEMKELLDECNWEWVSMKDREGNDIYGYKVTRKDDIPGEIFLPAAGYKGFKDEIISINKYVNYWSSSQIVLPKFGKRSYLALSLHFLPDNETLEIDVIYRYYGCTIRAVTDF